MEDYVWGNIRDPAISEGQLVDGCENAKMGKKSYRFHRKADDMIWINFAMNWEAVEYILQENWNFRNNGRPTPCSMLQATIGDKLRAW